MEGIRLMIARMKEHQEAMNTPNEGDYQNAEGLWICGNCNGPRQKASFSGEFRVWVNCPCREEAKRERHAQHEAHKEAQIQKWREEEAMKAVERVKHMSLMDAKLQAATFERAEITEENRRNFDICKRYADRFEIMENKSQGLLFYGDVGTGKSYAAACIANELLNRGVPVVITSLVKMIDSLRGFETDVDQVMNRLRKARLLILDEVGAERTTEFVLEKMYQIIDARYNSNLPMIVTTNIELPQMTNEKNIELRRIYSRIMEKCYPMQWHGESWRTKEARTRYTEMERLLGGD